ncbi:hypothetical protein LMG19282_03104 [Cupriavidus campinensis]|nr:hypothetical protein LMG19282_03104 [Cupriavidus campinensis]
MNDAKDTTIDNFMTIGTKSNKSPRRPPLYQINRDNNTDIAVNM